MVAKEKKSEKSKVISARITGTNLALFNKMGLTPTQLIHYAIKKYSEEYTSQERLSLESKIQSTLVDINNCELELVAKRKLLKKLNKDLDEVIDQEYATKKKLLFPVLKERYTEEVLEGKVDCVEDFIKKCKSFIELQAFNFKINTEYLNGIVREFYEEESRQMEYDDFMSKIVYPETSN